MQRFKFAFFAAAILILGCASSNSSGGDASQDPGSLEPAVDATWDSPQGVDAVDEEVIESEVEAYFASCIYLEYSPYCRADNYYAATLWTIDTQGEVDNLNTYCDEYAPGEKDKTIDLTKEKLIKVHWYDPQCAFVIYRVDGIRSCGDHDDIWVHGVGGCCGSSSPENESSGFNLLVRVPLMVNWPSIQPIIDTEKSWDVHSPVCTTWY